MLICWHFKIHYKDKLKYILISVKMPTLVGILTFMSSINENPECIKARKILYFLAIMVNDQFQFEKGL